MTVWHFNVNHPRFSHAKFDILNDGVFRMCFNAFKHYFTIEIKLHRLYLVLLVPFNSCTPLTHTSKSSAIFWEMEIFRQSFCNLVCCAAYDISIYIHTTLESVNIVIFRRNFDCFILFTVISIFPHFENATKKKDHNFCEFVWFFFLLCQYKNRNDSSEFNPDILIFERQMISCESLQRHFCAWVEIQPNDHIHYGVTIKKVVAIK